MEFAQSALPHPRPASVRRDLSLPRRQLGYPSSPDWRDEILYFVVEGRPSLVVAGDASRDVPSRSSSETHGGFDNDPDTMNSVFERVLGRAPTRPFTLGDVRY